MEGRLGIIAQKQKKKNKKIKVKIKKDRIK